MIGNPDKLRFAQAALKTAYNLSPLSGEEIQQKAIEELVRKFDERLGLNTPTTKAARHKYFGIPGTQPEDFSEVLLDIEADKSVLVGIRHINRNPDSPYIEVWPNWLAENEEDLRMMATKITKSYSVFNPKFLCLWLNPTGRLLQGLANRSVIGQHVLASSVKEIETSLKPSHYGQLTLEPITDMSFYEGYLKDYTDFHSDSPLLKDRVPIVDLDNMKQSASDGLLFRARCEGRYCGLIAAKREDYLGHKGIYFLELLLLRSFRQRNLAAVLQRTFVDKIAPLESNRDIIIWGTIDSLNLPSLKTALRVGRKVISTECFYRLGE